MRGSDERYFCSAPPPPPPLMVFWWVSYLAKRLRPDFNNGSGNNWNCGCILGPRHLFEFDLNNDPSPGNFSLGSDRSNSVHLNLWSPKILIIHLTSSISGPRLDFNNCPWDNLNNSCILIHRRLCLTQIMPPSQVFTILVK